MKFDTPATDNPIDQLKVIGRPTDRIDGPLKTTGTAPYAYERHDVAPNQAYGYIIGSAIAKGRIRSMDLSHAKTAPGESHAMMEPHASIAAWEGDKLTVWTSNQMIEWGQNDLAKTLGIPPENV